MLLIPHLADLCPAAIVHTLLIRTGVAAGSCWVAIWIYRQLCASTHLRGHTIEPNSSMANAVTLSQRFRWAPVSLSPIADAC